MEKVRNRDDATEDEVTRELVQGGDELLIDWIWRLCNKDFESDLVSEGWKSVIVPLYKGKGKMNESKVLVC